MKTPKCPLCGTPLKAIRGYDVHGITTDWVAGCYNCFFQSSHIYPVTIVSKDLDLCKITVRDYAGDSFIIYCDEVEQWPWEIEQKGGSND